MASIETLLNSPSMAAVLKFLLIAYFCLVGVARADAPIILRFSHVVAPDTPKGKAADFFARRAFEATGGRVKVEVFPNSQLFKDREELEALQLGTVQMLAPSLAKFTPLGVKGFEVFDLPYIFENEDKLHRITQGTIGRNLLQGLESRGILGLAYWDNGFKQMSANRPLHLPADFKGLKMRVQGSRVLEAQMRALGAQAVSMDFSEVYRALRAGVVDGTENPVSNLYTQHMHEVQKYLTLSNHGYLGYAVIVNRRFWDDLPRDLRRALETALAEATQFANDIARKENQEALARVKAAGLTQVFELTAAERVEWKKALVQVHRQMETRIGRDTIQAIYRETGFNPEKP